MTFIVIGPSGLHPLYAVSTAELKRPCSHTNLVLVLASLPGSIKAIDEGSIKAIDKGSIKPISKGSIQSIDEGSIKSVDEGSIKTLDEGNIKSLGAAYLM